MLLQATNGGLDFYQFVFKHKLIPCADNERFENVQNPFYDDSNASLSIYGMIDKRDKDKRWYFKDHGEPDYHGDVFDFASYYYNLDMPNEFNEIMECIVKDLNIDISLVTDSDEFKKSDLYKNGFVLIRYSAILEKLNTERYFLKEYHIPYEVCQEYKTCVIKGYSKYKVDHNIKNCNAWENEFLIAYRFDSFAKIYHPLPVDNKWFCYIGTNSDYYIFGWKEIQNRWLKFKNPRTTLILTGGEKDVLSLATLGYDAISLYSENAKIPDFVIETIFPYYDKIIIMYDNDKTGLSRMDELSKKYKIGKAILPNSINGKQIKDISDCMKYQVDRKFIDELIANVEQINSKVEPSKNIQTEVLPATINSDVEQTPIEIRKGNDNNSNKFLIPTSVYENLPSFLQNICTLFTDENSKDLILLSCLTVLSTCFPKVKGICDRSASGTNLYLFITGRSACGKGDAKWSRKLLCGIEDLLQSRFKSELSDYKRNLSEYDKNKDENPDLEKPEEPLQKFIEIPANSSTSKFIEMLDANKDFGLIFETEGDVVSFAQRSDWSNYSNQLRQAFHHERIQQARKSNGLYVVESPHLSVMLTGTLDQVPSLIKSVENGLLSRFLFYNFPDNLEYISPFACVDDYSKYFEGFSNELLGWWKAFEAFEDECIISFTTEQIIIFDQYFANKAKELELFYNRDIIASVRRMELIHFRLCMLLTVIRHIETNKVPSKSLVIDDIDFINSLEIIDVLCNHLEIIFSRLTSSANSTRNISLNSREKSLYEKLPEDFTWEQFKQLALSLEIPQGTAEKYRRKFVEKQMIIQIKNGVYKK